MRRPCIRSVPFYKMSQKVWTLTIYELRRGLTVFLRVGPDRVVLVVGCETVHRGLYGVDVGGLADLVAEEPPQSALFLAVGVVHAVGQLVVGAVLGEQLREQDVALESVDRVEGVTLGREEIYSKGQTLKEFINQ